MTGTAQGRVLQSSLNTCEGNARVARKIPLLSHRVNEVLLTKDSKSCNEAGWLVAIVSTDRAGPDSVRCLPPNGRVSQDGKMTTLAFALVLAMRGCLVGTE